MFPYPGIPYGVAPAWCFPLMEGSMLLLAVLCLVHAVRSPRRGAVPYLLGGFAFGLVLEYIEVLTGSYTYGRFHLMLGHAPLDIPVCIGAGWAIILYSSRLFSDALGLPMLGAAALDTLLALNIDLSMDVVAYRLHMWHWYWDGTGLNPLTAQWFGIPYGNFVGWITVVFCYSGFSRLFEARIGRKAAPAGAWRFPLIAVLALVCSQAVLFSLESFAYPALNRIAFTSGKRLLFDSAVLLVLAAEGWRKRTREPRPMPALARWVPCWLHLLFFTCFLALGFFRENRAMTTVAMANFAVGFVLHLVPCHARATRGPVTASGPMPRGRMAA